MTKRWLLALTATTAIAGLPAYAADLGISITNLTRGTYFTPLLVAAHTADTQLFTVGSVASTNLQMMAEGGDISGLVTDLTGIGATIVENPAAGLLGPGELIATTLNTDAATDNTRLSVVGMMLPTNDGFVAMNAIDIPTAAGTYSFMVNAWDAGTEANDEIRGSGAPGEAGFPAPGPIDTSAGMNGTGTGATVEGFVHVHRNVLGDADSTAGTSDIDSTVHRWLNPVARIVITVN